MTEKFNKEKAKLSNRVFSNLQQWSQKHNLFKDGLLSTRKSDLEFALTILLVDLASSDQHGFDSAEFQVIQQGLHRIFGTQALLAQRLINQAILTLKDLRDTSSYGQLLKTNLAPSQRFAIMEIVDQVIAADDVKDGFELYLRRRIAQLLEIEAPKKQEED